MDDVFTVADLRSLSELAIETWTAGIDLDWNVPAGMLEWSCWSTAAWRHQDRTPRDDGDQSPAPDSRNCAAGDFAPRGALELSVHTHDIAAGLGIEFEVPAEVALRLREHTAGWPLPEPPHYEPSANPWADVLTRFGRQTHS